MMQFACSISGVLQGQAKKEAGAPLRASAAGRGILVR